MADIERRALMKGAALGALAFTVGGTTVMLTAGQAHARNAGIAHFIDQQISVPPEEALLQARILNVRPPFVNFYRAAIGVVDRTSDKVYAAKFAQLSTDTQREFVGLMRQNKLEGWQGGPPGAFVYTVLRSDAVDVVYSTMDGYEMLGVPYMPHIAPERRW